MTKLSVNINKFATLRNSRGEDLPNLLNVAADCQRFGADGITVHPRQDERHVKRQDVLDIPSVITTEYNIEGYPSHNFIELVKIIRPTQVTLVPDTPEALTSNAGWNTKEFKNFLKDVVESLQSLGIRVSIFVDTNEENIVTASEIGADRVDLYAADYAHKYKENREEAVAPYIRAANVAHEHGLGVNAGHDLSLENLKYLHDNIPWLKEVSVGHALICDALYMGLENAILSYKKILE